MQKLLTLPLIVAVALALDERVASAEESSGPAATVEPHEVQFYYGGPPLSPRQRLGSISDDPKVGTMFHRLESGGTANTKLRSWGSASVWMIFFDSNGWTLAAYRIDPDLVPSLGIRPYAVSGSREKPVIGTGGKAFVVSPLSVDEFLGAAGIESKEGQISADWLKRWRAKAQ